MQTTRQHPSKRLLLIPLLPLFWLYRFIIALRNFCYDHDIFKSTKLPALVISIGNLSAGGAGKTPATIFLANALREQNWKVAIVARGYRRQKKGLVVVSDGRQILAEVAAAGDEPLLMAQACPGVPVIVDEQKKEAARAAVKNFGPDIVLIDDGFQHRQLHRDLDVVLLDARTPVSRLFWFPPTPMREPFSAIRRADFIIIRMDRDDAINERLIAACRRYSPAPIMAGTLQPIRWLPLDSERSEPILPLTALAHRPVLLVSGIANPGRFREMVKSMSADIRDELVFTDHYQYRAPDVAAITTATRVCGAQYILTTSKDAVKLAALLKTGAVLGAPALVLETTFVPEPNFLEFLQQSIRTHQLQSVHQT